MINLIPHSARAQIKTEYWLRAVTVWSFMLAFALLLIFALQLPTYVLVISLDEALRTQINTAAATQGEFADLEQQVIDTNNLVVHLTEQEQQTVRFSELMYELDAISPAAVQLMQFDMRRADGRIEAIEVVGRANSRTALSNYRDRVEAHELFGAAELPISNLAKDSDIPFSMTITMAEIIDE
ncbi:MAG: hypothetical protein AAFO91_14800 [Bacteroidota bacterium]